MKLKLVPEAKIDVIEANDSFSDYRSGLGNAL